MEKIITLRNDLNQIYFEMSYHEDKNYLLCRWMGACASMNIRQAVFEMMKWAKENARANDCKAVLNDTRQMQGPWTKSLGWWRENCLPEMVKYGIELNALTESTDLFARLSGQMLVEKGAAGITTKMFKNIGEAENWFAQQQEKAATLCAPKSTGLGLRSFTKRLFN